MRISLILVILINALLLSAQAQTQPYGIIDTADLKMTSCDFEKDANAEVLFDKASVTYKYSTVIEERHKRVKIFNDNGKGEADVRIEFLGVEHDEEITDLEAETINLNDQKIEYTPVDKAQIYTQNVDKETKAIIFTFPGVHKGSVIEYQYKLTTPYGYNYPDWFFQGAIPNRYSEFDASFIPDYPFTILQKTYQTLSKDTSMVTKRPSGTRHIWALSNIKAYKKEPDMDYPDDYEQCVIMREERKGYTWIGVGNNMLKDEDFGQQIHDRIAGEEDIIKKASTYKTDEQKIQYIFDTVRNAMKWNKIDRWYCDDGMRKSWNKKTGNSAEINMIVYHLLALANVDTYLLALRTRGHGKLYIGYPTMGQLNKTVVYCPIDSNKQYVLDATDKLNSYKTTPLDLVGLYGLSIEAESKKISMVILKPENAREVILINGKISPEGKLEGTAQISSSTYLRQKYLHQYNDLGEKAYLDEIQKENESLKISSLQMDNMQNDTLPLNQSFNFKYNLTEPDGDYMYFNPNLLTGFRNNPFLSDQRISNIDFGFMANYSINGRYAIPLGYKVDVLPKSINMQMPDKTITFKRIVAEQEGVIIIHYIIDFKQSLFVKDEYPSLHDFYKKMFEMLNEQIVLKKAQ